MGGSYNNMHNIIFCIFGRWIYTVSEAESYFIIKMDCSTQGPLMAPGLEGKPASKCLMRECQSASQNKQYRAATLWVLYLQGWALGSGALSARWAGKVKDLGVKLPPLEECIVGEVEDVESAFIVDIVGMSSGHKATCPLQYTVSMYCTCN